MAIVGTVWAAELYTQLQGKGFLGSALMDFCTAVGQGSENHVVGQTFDTVDVGSIPSAGPAPGSGVGISGFSDADISNAVFARCVAAFGQAGSKLKDVCDAIGLSCLSQMALADLSSLHSPVFLGSGTITPGSLSIDGAGWGGEIDTEGLGLSFNGLHWPDFADAIGQGQADHVQPEGTGTVTIAGAPSGPPVPGAGTGSGSIS